MSLNSKFGLISRLRRGKKARERFVDSHINKNIAFQIRATRELLGISQEELAKRAGMNQNAIYRLESPSYGKPTLTTLKRIAAALDVALVVRLVPFSEMIDWVSGTPRLSRGLTTSALTVPTFEREEEAGEFDLVVPRREAMTASGDTDRDHPTAASGSIDPSGFKMDRPSDARDFATA